MRAFLSTPIADTLGHVMLRLHAGATQPGATARRLTRVSTLDGGVVVNDGGFAAGDATIVLAWVPSAAQDAAVRRLVETYATLTLSTRDGVYVAAPSRFDVAAGRSTLTLYVTQRLTS